MPSDSKSNPELGAGGEPAVAADRGNGGGPDRGGGGGTGAVNGIATGNGLGAGGAAGI